MSSGVGFKRRRNVLRTAVSTSRTPTVDRPTSPTADRLIDEISAADIRAVQIQRTRSRMKPSTPDAAAADTPADTTNDDDVAVYATVAPLRGDGVESGDRWLVGISEVRIADEETANHERTKRALARASATAAVSASADTDTAVAIGGSLSSNFIYHRAEWNAVNNHRDDSAPAAATTTAAASPPSANARSTDSRVVDRFVKRMKNR